MIYIKKFFLILITMLAIGTAFLVVGLILMGVRSGAFWLSAQLSSSERAQEVFALLIGSLFLSMLVFVSYRVAKLIFEDVWTTPLSKQEGLEKLRQEIIRRKSNLKG